MLSLNNFSSFISKKRKEKKMSLREFSRRIGISPEYLSKIENELRSAPKDDTLEKMADKLGLNIDEREMLFDLAADSKPYLSLASDLLLYIKQNKSIHKALRLAKRCDADEEDWQNFIDFLSEKYL
mgnify:CR=1 FL=1